MVELAPKASSNPAGAKKSEFPCLNIQPKYSKMNQVVGIPAKHSELDKKVKKLLVLTPDKFTEWMMQQSLVPNDQV